MLFRFKKLTRQEILSERTGGHISCGQTSGTRLHGAMKDSMLLILDITICFTPVAIREEHVILTYSNCEV